MFVLVLCSLPFMFQVLPILRRARQSDQTLLSLEQRPLLQNQISLHLKMQRPQHLANHSQAENAVQVGKHQRWVKISVLRPRIATSHQSNNDKAYCKGNTEV